MSGMAKQFENEDDDLTEREVRDLVNGEHWNRCAAQIYAYRVCRLCGQDSDTFICPECQEG